MKTILAIIIALAIPAGAHARTLLWSDSGGPGTYTVTFLYDARAQTVLVGCRGTGDALIWVNRRLFRCHNTQPYRVVLRHVKPGQQFRSFERFLADVRPDTASWS